MTGLYVLRLEVAQEIDLAVGALGRVTLSPGAYLYVGSARRGLVHRVARHRQPEKSLRWHIDYLTSQRACTVASAVVFEQAPFSECTLCQELQRGLHASTPVKGFGSSDCRAGCAAHLLFLPRPVRDGEIREIASNSRF